MTKKIVAKTCAVKLATQEAFDEELMTSALNSVAKNPVSVSGNTVTFEEEDQSAIESVLAELGVEYVQETPEENAVSGQGEGEGEDVLDITAEAIEEADSVQGVLCNAGSIKASWLLVAGERPVARIRLNALQGGNQISALFSSSKYMEHLKASFTKHGVKATLQRLKAEVISDKEIELPEVPDVEEAVTASMDKFRRGLSLAIVATNKNFVQNRLKAAAYSVLAEMEGVEEPEAVVEAIFAEAEDFIEDLVEVGTDYAELDESAFQASAKLLTGAAIQRAPSAKKPLTASAKAMRASLQEGNFPLNANLGVTAEPEFEGEEVAPITASAQQQKKLFAQALATGLRY